MNNVVLSSLDYGAYDEIIGVSRDNKVYSRLQISDDRPGGKSWKLLAEGYKLATVSSYGYWLISEDDLAYFSAYQPSLGVYKTFNVVRIDGKFKKITAGFGDNVWAIDRDNYVFRRMNVNSLTPSGTHWQAIEGFQLVDIAAGYNVVYGITKQGRIVRYKGTFVFEECVL